MEHKGLKAIYGIGEENLACITEQAKDYALSNGDLLI